MTVSTYRGTSASLPFAEHRGWRLRWDMRGCYQSDRNVIRMAAFKSNEPGKVYVMAPCFPRGCVPIRRVLYPKKTEGEPMVLLYFTEMEREILAAIDAVEIEEAAWTIPSK